MHRPLRRWHRPAGECRGGGGESTGAAESQGQVGGAGAGRPRAGRSRAFPSGGPDGGWVESGGRGSRSWWRLKPPRSRWERGSVEKLAVGLGWGGEGAPRSQNSALAAPARSSLLQAQDGGGHDTHAARVTTRPGPVCLRLTRTQGQRGPLRLARHLGPVVGAPSASRGSGPAPPVTPFPAGPRRGPEAPQAKIVKGVERPESWGAATQEPCCGGCGGVVPPPGAADSPAPCRSGHASLAVQTSLWRGKEVEASPVEAHPSRAVPVRGAGGTMGLPL